MAEHIAQAKSLLLLALLLGLVCACSVSPSEVSDDSTATSAAELKGVTLKSIAVTPAPSTVYANAREMLIATGTYSDGSAKDVSATATWTSSNTNIATVGASGVVTTVADGSATITAQLGSVKGRAAVHVSVTLTSIAVTPPSTSLPANTTVALKATGSFTNEGAKNLTDTVTWTSSNPAVASVSASGVVATIAAGSATIIATTSAFASAPVVGTATIMVNSETMQLLVVTPATRKLPLGTAQRMTATATFSDGTRYVLAPPVVAWKSSAPTVASISASGIASALALGNPAVVTATSSSGLAATSAVTVTAAKLLFVTLSPSTSSITAGSTQPFMATGAYSDGSTTDVTDQATWTSSDTSIATVSKGLSTSVSAGTATITATDPKTKKAGTASLTVSPAVDQAIAIAPTAPSVPVGLTTQLDAVEIRTDGTTGDVTSVATWTSSNVAIATVSQGLTSGVAPGTATITVDDPVLGLTQSVTITVTPGVLTSINVTPQNPSFAVDTTNQLVATAAYSDGTSGDVTSRVIWTSTSSAIAAANAPGRPGEVTTLGVDIAFVYAADPATGVSGLTVVTSTGTPSLVSIAVGPPELSLAVGAHSPLTAMGTYTDGSTHDITSAVSWSSSGAWVTVSNAPGTVGLATALGVGAAIVVATDPTSVISGRGFVTGGKFTPATPATRANIAAARAAYVGGATSIDLTGDGIPDWTITDSGFGSRTHAFDSDGDGRPDAIRTTSSGYDDIQIDRNHDGIFEYERSTTTDAANPDVFTMTTVQDTDRDFVPDTKSLVTALPGGTMLSVQYFYDPQQTGVFTPGPTTQISRSAASASSTKVLASCDASNAGVDFSATFDDAVATGIACLSGIDPMTAFLMQALVASTDVAIDCLAQGPGFCGRAPNAITADPEVKIEINSDCVQDAQDSRELEAILFHELLHYIDGVHLNDANDPGDQVSACEHWCFGNGNDVGSNVCDSQACASANSDGAQFVTPADDPCVQSIASCEKGQLKTQPVPDGTSCPGFRECQSGSCQCPAGTTSCKGLCTNEDCPAGQTFDTGACACIDSNNPPQTCEGIVCEPGQIQDPFSCSCYCPPGTFDCNGQCTSPTCTNGGTFDSVTCKCECPAGAQLCNGLCRSTVCPAGSGFDPDSCSCTPNSTACPNDNTFRCGVWCCGLDQACFNDSAPWHVDYPYSQEHVCCGSQGNYESCGCNAGIGTCIYP